MTGVGWLREQAGFPVTAAWGRAPPGSAAVKVGVPVRTTTNRRLLEGGVMVGL